MAWSLTLKYIDLELQYSTYNKSTILYKKTKDCKLQIPDQD